MGIEMKWSSLRKDRLKFETFGKILPIVLDESKEYTFNERQKN